MPTTKLDFKTLKAKEEDLNKNGQLPDNFALRIHRAISWGMRAEREIEDDDVRFILLWIGFNAAYVKDSDIFYNTNTDTKNSSQRNFFKTYFDALIELDSNSRIYDAVWDRFKHEVRILLDNKYIFEPFWKHHHNIPNYNNWQERFEKSKRVIGFAIDKREKTALILSTIFDRLYVLRNQLMHGSATWDSSINRNQVRDGAKIMGWLLPLFIDIMMDNPNENWGQPPYPVIEP